MAILLGIGLLLALFFWGRSVATTLGKSLREAGIYVLVLLGMIAIGTLVVYSY